MLAFLLNFLDRVFIDGSCVPNAAHTVFRARNEVERLAIVRGTLVDLDTTWNELDVTDETLMALLDWAHDDVLHDDWRLLPAFLVIIFVFLLECLSSDLDSALL